MKIFDMIKAVFITVLFFALCLLLPFIAIIGGSVLVLFLVYYGIGELRKFRAAERAERIKEAESELPDIKTRTRTKPSLVK